MHCTLKFSSPVILSIANGQIIAKERLNLPPSLPPREGTRNRCSRSGDREFSPFDAIPARTAQKRWAYTNGSYDFLSCRAVTMIVADDALGRACW